MTPALLAASQLGVVPFFRGTSLVERPTGASRQGRRPTMLSRKDRRKKGKGRKLPSERVTQPLQTTGLSLAAYEQNNLRAEDLHARALNYVRSALAAGEDYHKVKEKHFAAYQALWLKLSELPFRYSDVQRAEQKDHVFQRIKRSVGEDWMTVVDLGDTYVQAASQMVLRLSYLQAPSPDSEAMSAERTSQADYNRGLTSFLWSFDALQLSSAEELPLSEELLDAIEDGLLQGPQQAFWAAVRAFYARGGKGPAWLPLYYEMEETRGSRAALGLLLRAVDKGGVGVRQDRENLHNQLNLGRMSTLCLGGLRSVLQQADHVSVPSAFLRKLDSLIAARYRQERHRQS